MAAAKSSSLARERWQLLKAALFKKSGRCAIDSSSSASVRRFTSFGLFVVENAPPSDGNTMNIDWLFYSYPPLSTAVKVGLIPQEFTLQDIGGFNNTGNVCIWPSEEVMAFYCLENIEVFRGKCICELGAGMTGLAGLMLAATLAPTKILLTDGNSKSIDNLNAVIQANYNQLSDIASASLLSWDVNKLESEYSGLKEQYDSIICADCFFFSDVQENLVILMCHLLKSDGKAYLFAPERSGTFTEFLKKADQYFRVNVLQHYHQVMNDKHLYYTRTDPSYDPNLHYPLCAILER